MKSILRQKYPKLHRLKDNKANEAKVAAALKDAWAEVDQALIDRLIESMPRRMKEVRRVRGWYTKY